MCYSRWSTTTDMFWTPGRQTRELEPPTAKRCNAAEPRQLSGSKSTRNILSSKERLFRTGGTKCLSLPIDKKHRSQKINTTERGEISYLYRAHSYCSARLSFSKPRPDLSALPFFAFRVTVIFFFSKPADGDINTTNKRVPGYRRWTVLLYRYSQVPVTEMILPLAPLFTLCRIITMFSLLFYLLPRAAQDLPWSVRRDILR